MDPSITWTLALLAAYAIGSIPIGLLWGRWLHGIDVRTQGSGNLGATNVMRVLGARTGTLVLLLDAGKGAAGVLIGRGAVESTFGGMACGLAALLGHILNPWLRFRGGKGVATGLGMWLLLAPAATGIALGVFALVLAVGRRVSAASLAASAALAVAVERFAAGEGEAARVALAVATAVLVWVRHRTNVGRLLRGDEPPLWGRKAS